MINLSKNLRNIIIAIILIVAAFVGYTYFFGKKPEAALTATPVAGETAVDQDLVATLFKLKSITLDDSIFSDPTFKSLTDFGQELIPEPVGRVNPFAPLNR